MYPPSPLWDEKMGRGIWILTKKKKKVLKWRKKKEEESREQNKSYHFVLNEYDYKFDFIFSTIQYDY